MSRTATAALVLAALMSGCANGGPDGPGDSPPGTTQPTTTAPTGSPGPTATPASTPTPTPTASEDPADVPPLGELTISTSGVGPLRVGVPPDENPGAAMIEWDPDRCADIATGPDAGRWVVTAYGAEDTDYTGAPTEPVLVGASDEGVHRIDVMGTSPTTEAGIGIGATVPELREAYPELAGPHEGPVSRVWWVEGEDGTMVFETQGAEEGLRPAGTPESVILIRVLEPGYPPDFATANSDDVAGSCL